MYKRVLIPVDGSETAEAILPFILEIAGPLDLEVVLLRTYQPVPPLAGDGASYVIVDDEPTLEACEEYVARLRDEVAAKGLRVTARVRRGPAVDEILAAARETGSDLIAMTTHGRTGPGRLLFGSVAVGVLRHADVPVFVMRQTERDIARRRQQVAR
jgi:nucleotide-binding universal stress UspA family protein